MIDLAKKLDKTPAQVVLSWVVQRGIVALTKSVTPSRIESNLEGMFTTKRRLNIRTPTNSTPVFELPPDAFKKMESLDRKHRYNFPARLGVDIFAEADPAVMAKAVKDFKKTQMELRGIDPK